MSYLDEVCGYEGHEPPHKPRNRQRWIPVEEMMPEEGAEVFAYSPSIGRQVAHIVAADGGVAWYWGTSGVLGIDATHWMPLPEPPEVK